MKELTLCGMPVRVDHGSMVCLTDLWKASGGLEKNKPIHYLKNGKTKEFISAMSGVMALT